MTYAELFVFVDTLREKLPQRAISVLNHLIARCIVEGSNEIELSIIRLAANLGMSPDPVRDAAIRLEGLIEVRVASGVSMRWILPADWFEPQRSLFTVSTAADKYRNLAKNQAGTLLETRQVPCEKPGRYLTRNQAGNPGNQVGNPGNQAGPAWKPGMSPLETRQVYTQNQQLSDNPRQIRSDRILDSSDHFGIEVDQIVARTKIPAALKREGEILSQYLRAFFDRHGVAGPVPTGPSESTLARILALAPLETILKRLEEMESEKLGRPKKWVWFLLLFAQDLCGISKDAMLTALTKQSERKPPRSAPDPHFAQQTLNHVTAGVRNMR